MQTVAALGADHAPQEEPLPRLRDDLRLYEGPPDADGAPTWTVYDPVRGKYFRIGLLAFRLLSHWPLRVPSRVLAAATQGTTLQADGDDIADMVRFLRANNLVAGDTPGQQDSYLAQVAATRVSWASWLLHNYLFIRIPLLRPDRFLTRTLPYVRPLFTRTCVTLLLVIGGVGLFRAARRWDEFVTTFMHFFSLEGALLMGLTISVTKVLHEFGHAYMAKRFGCRVHSMGVAFLVMFPVLYTDVTDAWRLISRRERLLIGAAGMMTELGLALIATLLWSVLPDGMLRSAAFMVATVTWVTTLAVNLNPFMKFDGYFLLSDFTGVHNLQDRAFALARWKLREVLFGLGEPAPEALPRQRASLLIGWAYITWIWRFFLFLGIALLVYHLFFKVLGIFLMLVEIVWFIGRPIWQELKEWGSRRQRIRLNVNTTITLVMMGLGIAALVLPWQSRVSLPATLEASIFGTLFAPVPAQVAKVHARAGDEVLAGNVIYELHAPDLENELSRVQQEVDVMQRMILRQAASPDTLGQLGVLQSQLASHLVQLQGLRAQQDKLTVRAPVSGVLTDVQSGLSVGLWVNESVLLGRVVNPQQARLRAYVRGSDLERIQRGNLGRFLPEDPRAPAIPVRVETIESLGMSALDNPYVASTHEGPIAVREAQGRQMVPTEAWYRVILAPTEGQQAPASVRRGTVLVEAESTSLLARGWRLVVSTLVRESGF